jgi:hypothetical protein
MLLNILFRTPEVHKLECEGTLIIIIIIYYVLLEGNAVSNCMLVCLIFSFVIPLKSLFVKFSIIKSS